jgi:ribosomal protein S18 acetylase RimI-like enzyme
VHQEWTIKPAGPEHTAALALVGAATFLESFAGILAGKDIVAHCCGQNSPEIFGKYLAGGAQIWLAEADKGAPVGYAMLTASELPAAQAGDIELKRIYTLSRFHGSGVGGALMQKIVGAANGYQRLLLGVYRHNERAIAFYHKQGFELVGTRQFNVGGTLYDDLVFAKPLS